jgi:hypothetical protein
MPPDKRKKPRDLVQHDWDFSDCPQAELPICLRYEYCRESRIAEVIRLFRKRQAAFNSFYQKTTRIYDKSPNDVNTDSVEFKLAASSVGMSALLNLDLFACLPNFPDWPWLDLSSVERDEYMKIVKDTDALGQSIRGLHIAGEKENHELSIWQSVRQSLHPQAVLGGFEIHPGSTQSEILSQFKDYLQRIKSNAPDFFLRKTGGRGQAKDKLNQLGAFRLLLVHSPKKAVIELKAGKMSALYDEDGDNSWYRARDKAIVQIESFNRAADILFPLVKLLK